MDSQQSAVRSPQGRFMMSEIIFLAILTLLLSGCARVMDAAIEGAKGVAGISTEALEENRKNAIKKNFNYNSDICYNESKRILKNTGCYIYAQDPKKKMIAVYVSETDTTMVGVFFKVIDDFNTQVEVSSRSTFGKEFVSKRLFAGLENLSKKDEELEKGPDDAKDNLENK